MKNQGYKKLYKQIWEERKEWGDDGEYVQCSECPVRIYEHELNVWHFAHILSKGSNPKLKLDPNNVAIKCAKCHGTEHASGKFNNHTGIK